MHTLLLAALLPTALAAGESQGGSEAPPSDAPAPPATLAPHEMDGADEVPDAASALRKLQSPPSPADVDGDRLPDSTDPCPKDPTNTVLDGRCADGSPVAGAPPLQAPASESPPEPVAATPPVTSPPPAADAPAAPRLALSLDELRTQAVDAPTYQLQLKDLVKAAETPPPFQRLKAWLKPSPGHLPARPRGQVDYTAYVLEWGELKVGLANVALGVLPHVQVGTNPLLHAARIPNASAKLDATSSGLFDVSVHGSYYSLPRGIVNGQFIGTGATTSFSFPLPGTIPGARIVSAHLGADYAWLEGSGALDFSTIGELVTGREIAPGTLVADAGLRGEMITARAAVDMRLNRRDTIILQGSSTIYGRSEASENVEQAANFLSLDEALRADGFVSPTENYVASLAWHLAWEHLEARIGVGTSSVPGAWLLQTTELSWRFFGRTRNQEREQRKTWKLNEQKERQTRPPGAP